MKFVLRRARPFSTMKRALEALNKLSNVVGGGNNAIANFREVVHCIFDVASNLPRDNVIRIGILHVPDAANYPVVFTGPFVNFRTQRAGKMFKVGFRGMYSQHSSDHVEADRGALYWF